MLNAKFKVGDIVSSVSGGGVWLAEKPVDGTYNQKFTNTEILKDFGVVCGINSVVIDYDTWTDIYESLGKIEYIQYYIKIPTGAGWVGEGAIK